MIDTFTYASLVLTPAHVFLSVVVSLRYGRLAWRAHKAGAFAALDWFYVAVAIGFAGAAADSLYWAVPWTLDHLDHPAAEAWFGFGSVPNVFSRQGAGMTSAYLHIFAAFLALTPRERWKRMAGYGAVAVGLSALYALILGMAG